MVGGQEAAALVADAATAKSNASTALSQITAIVSDSVLDRSEKPEVVRQWEAIAAEQSTINARASSFSITTENTTYNNAITALAGYLGSLSPLWYDATTDTPIVRATFIGKFNDVYYARQLVLDKIAQVGGRNVNFIWLRSNSTPATPTGNGIPAGWSDDPPIGTAFLWFSKANQERDGTTIGAWSAPAHHDGPQGPTGVSAPPVAGLDAAGSGELAEMLIGNGQTVTVQARSYLLPGSTEGTVQLQVQISEKGSGSWSALTNGTATSNAPSTDPAPLTINAATFTNSGADRLFLIRSVCVSLGRLARESDSYLRVI